MLPIVNTRCCMATWLKVGQPRPSTRYQSFRLGTKDRTNFKATLIELAMAESGTQLECRHVRALLWFAMSRIIYDTLRFYDAAFSPCI